MPTERPLRVGDVARIWGEERARQDARRRDEDEAAAVRAARPLARRTVWNILTKARTGPYQAQPPPMPDYPGGEDGLGGRRPEWWPQEGEDMAGLEKRLRDWWHTGKPGRGAGGGRRPKVKRGEAPR
jgi:hypothetical protein